MSALESVKEIRGRMFFFWLLLLSVAPVWTYEAPGQKQDVFVKKACPAFLTFMNVAFVAGATVELPCHCKPHEVQSVVWFLKKHHEKPEQTKALTRHNAYTLSGIQDPQSHDLRSRFAIRLFLLLIHRASVDDSGIYMCGSTKGDFFYAYDVDIQEAEIILPNSPSSLMKLAKEDASYWGETPPYQLITAHSPWSVCDRCGVPGEQVRFGVCYVDSKYLHVRYQGSHKKRLSCGSGSVPQVFTSLRELKNAATIEVNRCNVTCPPQSKSSSKLKDMMNFLGLSPPHESATSLSYQNHPANSDLIISCPEARFNTVVAWDRGSEPIYRTPHLAASSDSSHPRLTIDAGHNLHFNPAKVEDSGVYTCWLQGQRAAEIHLLVYDLFGQGRSIYDPEFLQVLYYVMIGYGSIAGVFIVLLVVRTAVEYWIEPPDAHED